MSRLIVININVFSVLKTLLIIVYVYAFFSKLLRFEQFELDLFSSPLIPEFLVGILSYLIPLIEVWIIFTLLFFLEIWVYLFNLVMMFAYTVYMVVYEYISEGECGCNKLFESLGFKEHLVFNMLLLLIAVFMFERLKNVMSGTISGE